MELLMLSELDFNIDFVSSNSFLERFVQISGADKPAHDLAQYMLEISMLDYLSIHTKPSYLAMSALYQALKILRRSNQVSNSLLEYT